MYELKFDKKALDFLNKLEKETRPVRGGISITSDKADYVQFKRKVPIRKGKWRILPQEVEEAIKKKKNEDS